MAGAVGVAAAADLQAQPEEPLPGDDGSLRPGRGPQRAGAGGAGPRVGGQFQGPVGGGPSTPSRHGAAPRSGGRSRSNKLIALHQTDFAALEKPRRNSAPASVRAANARDPKISAT